MQENGIGSKGKVLPEQRRALIRQMIRQEGSVNTEALAERFDVSYMTIWRDITLLEEGGNLQRVRGGAIMPESTAAPEPAYFSKQTVRSREKEAIACYVARHLAHDNEILILDAGTTVAAITKYLTQRNLTVVTNGVQTILEAMQHTSSMTVMSCGGILREPANTFVGPQAERFFDDLSAHTFFLGATGLSFPEGITDPNPLEIQVKRAMATSAARIVLLLDSSKFGVRSLLPVVPLAAVHEVVTDNQVSSADVDRLVEMGIKVHVVDPAEPCPSVA
ncbi:MAG: DeoR/GlpR transcriptional regulator [Caldilineaceae bacterium]|nr:DeoR/GlpR transcriptional regulator [Caldilineaceae bacterium]